MVPIGRHNFKCRRWFVPRVPSAPELCIAADRSAGLADAVIGVQIHGKPQSVVSDDQPEAREGQAGRPGVAERFVLPLKPGNAGGGKGPQFKTDAIRSEGPGDWATYKLR